MGEQGRRAALRLAAGAVAAACAVTVVGLVCFAPAAEVPEPPLPLGDFVDRWAPRQGEGGVEALQQSDRTAEPVHVMPGGRSVDGVLFVDDDPFPCADATGLCAAPEGFAECRWCSQQECLTGKLYTKSNMASHKLRGEPWGRVVAASRAFSRKEPWTSKSTTGVMMFSCRFAGGDVIPLDEAGAFSVLLPRRESAGGEGPGVPREILLSRRLVRTPTIVRPGSVAACGPRTLGDVNANHIVHMSEHLRFHGFKSLYVYNAGSTTMRHPKTLEAYLARLAATNSVALRYLDVRNHQDATYGSTAEYAMLTSPGAGREWTKLECALRARRDGHDWVLFTELNEFVFPGEDMMEDNLLSPMADRLVGLVNEGTAGVSFPSVEAECTEDVQPDSEWPLDPVQSRAWWEWHMQRMSERGDAASLLGRRLKEKKARYKVFLGAESAATMLLAGKSGKSGAVRRVNSVHANRFGCMLPVERPQRLMALPIRARKPPVNFVY